MAHNKLAGTFKQLYGRPTNENRDKQTHLGTKTYYTYDYSYRNEDPAKLIKWCRKNFGERGMGWDFTISNGCVIVEIIDHKYKTMFNLWVL